MVDIEDMSSGISIMDLGLNEFKLDLLEYTHTHPDLDKTPYLEVDDRRQRLEKEIDRLDKLARKEKQPKKKFGFAQQINRLKKELEGI